MMIRIVDTTLRDGEQTPGVLFSLKEKVKIATLLDKAGVHFIEAGTPANSKDERSAIKEIIKCSLTSSIITWNRALKKDIDCSLSIGSKLLHISLPVSEIMIQEKLKRSHSWVLKQLEIAAEYLKTENVHFSVGAEDAARAENQFLTDYAITAEKLGACRLRICDTVGISDPFMIVNMVNNLKKSITIDLEIHAHNDLGMATANALAAVKAGANVIDTTVMGIGERAGNTPLEEIALALFLNYKVDAGIKLNLMRTLAKTVSIASQRPISRGKSVVGEGIFLHESGIHVDGIRKNTETYEPYHPGLVGASRKLVIGKHSGPKAIINKLKELGCYLDDPIPSHTIRKIRELASIQKGGVSDEEIRHIAKN